MAERGLTGDVARRVRQTLRAEVEADAGDRADNNALRWMTYGDEFDGPVSATCPAADTGRWSRRWRPVWTWSATPKSVRPGRGRRHPGHMRGRLGSTPAHTSIVTVPLGVLKRGRPRFDPPLPAPVQRAVDALGFGRYEKIALRFDSPFWRDDGVSHLIVFPPEQDQPAMWVFDLDAFGAGPVLCAHLFHTLTPYALDRPAAASRRAG